MKIDIFPHIFPKPFFDRMLEVAPDKGAIKRWLHIPVLWDLDARLRMMDEFGDYRQILTLSLPTIESLAPPNRSPELARLANDGMAQISAIPSFANRASSGERSGGASDSIVGSESVRTCR